MILLLAATNVLFGLRAGLVFSAVLLVLHIALAWGWVRGALPLRSPEAPDIAAAETLVEDPRLSDFAGAPLCDCATVSPTASNAPVAASDR